MTVHHLPNSDFPYTKLYKNPPQKNVLLLSCMDIRLLDNTAKFMDELNLQNRYDHVIFAGAGLGAGQRKSSGDVDVVCEKEGIHKQKVDFKWSNVFFDQLDIAITKLERKIKDIFILEHLDCGAYKYFQDSCDNQEYERLADDRKLDCLEPFHETAANAFAVEVVKFCQQKADEFEIANPEVEKPELKKSEDKKLDNPWENIQVHCLIMDLTGRVKDLPKPPTPAVQAVQTVKSKPTTTKKAKKNS